MKSPHQRAFSAFFVAFVSAVATWEPEMFPSEDAISQATLVGDISVIAKYSFAIEEFLPSFLAPRNSIKRVRLSYTSTASYADSLLADWERLSLRKHFLVHPLTILAFHWSWNGVCFIHVPRLVAGNSLWNSQASWWGAICKIYRGREISFVNQALSIIFKSTLRKKWIDCTFSMPR